MAANSVVTQDDLKTFYDTLVKPYLNGEGLSSGFAPIESSSTSSAAYETGRLIVWNNRLCEVIDDISIGDTFVVNTNVKYTDMDEQITQINSDLASKVIYNNNSSNISMSLSGDVLTITTF